MASMGLQGGTARCYDWFMDFLKCMDESKAPTQGLRRKECIEYLEDYNECLHHEKEGMRAHMVERERRRQEAAGQSSQ